MPFHLPRLGSSVEKYRVDCKVRYSIDKTTALTMATDVAAFANANGGHLLVGSQETGGILRKHVGLTSEEAESTKRAIDEAVRNYLRPKPVIDFPGPRRLRNGKLVLVVEVHSAPGQAVGVKQLDRDSWRFPVRVGTQTVFYSPEQLVLLMDVKFRRNIQHLFAAKGAAVKIRPAGKEHRWDAKLVEVEPEGNAAIFRFEHTKGGHFAALPIDAIDSVWRNGDLWHIQLNPALDCADLVVDFVKQHAVATENLAKLVANMAPLQKSIDALARTRKTRE